ncbi:MAG: hypothetical protein JWM10_465 [Myxococcaceae bacterium]|nr:hypothetical protein [Myxococcaceae bacterium]
MSAPPDEPPPAVPARHVPPSGWKIALVLTALVLGIGLTCTACLVSYMFYVDARQR